MSEWFKEHDWKSCDGGDSSGGSNPLLCAKKKERETLSFFYFKNKFSPLQSSVSVLPALGLFAMIYFASNVSARD